MALTRDGVPVRCWTFAGNTADTAIIRTVKDDLAGWKLHRMVWVADRGFASAANLLLNRPGDASSLMSVIKPAGTARTHSSMKLPIARPSFAAPPRALTRARRRSPRPRRPAATARSARSGRTRSLPLPGS